MTDKTQAVLKVSKPIVISRRKLIKAPEKVILTPKRGVGAIAKTKSSMLQARYLRKNIIYESQDGDFLGIPDYKLTIINYSHVTNKTSVTIACHKGTKNNTVYYETSDNVVKVIGQENYDTVLNSLLTIKYEELKVRGILALLTNDANITEPNNTSELQENYPKLTFKKLYSEPMSVKRSVIKSEKQDDASRMIDKEIQTNENCMDLIYQFKKPKRLKRSSLLPYVIKDVPKQKVKKVIVHPKDFEQMKNVDVAKNTENDVEPLTDLKGYLSDESSGSVRSTFSVLSRYSIENLVDRPEIYLNIDEHTANEASLVKTNAEQSELKTEAPIRESETVDPVYIRMQNGSKIMLTVKPDDEFHIATPQILKNLTQEERQNLLVYQAYIDWKCCLLRDEDDNLPIHNALLNHDLDWLRRQCIVLRNRQESLDITSNNMTPLQMSIKHCTAQFTTMLLTHGADPLLSDDEQRNALHLCVEDDGEHLEAILKHCRSNARQILSGYEELYKPCMGEQTDSELAAFLLQHVCSAVDNQGYTPLMLASKSGNYRAVDSLCRAVPSTVQQMMPNGGSTALYLAVGAACLEAVDRGDKSKIADHFAKTIQCLIEHEADPNTNNHSGFNVNDLLMEFSIQGLSSLIAQHMQAKHLNKVTKENYDSIMMLKKNKDGIMKIESYDKKEIKQTFSEKIIKKIPSGVLMLSTNDSSLIIGQTKVKTKIEAGRKVGTYGINENSELGDKKDIETPNVVSMLSTDEGTLLKGKMKVGIALTGKQLVQNLLKEEPTKNILTETPKELKLLKRQVTRIKNDARIRNKTATEMFMTGIPKEKESLKKPATGIVITENTKEQGMLNESATEKLKLSRNMINKSIPNVISETSNEHQIKEGNSTQVKPMILENISVCLLQQVKKENPELIANADTTKKDMTQSIAFSDPVNTNKRRRMNKNYIKMVKPYRPN